MIISNITKRMPDIHWQNHPHAAFKAKQTDKAGRLDHIDMTQQCRRYHRLNLFGKYESSTIDRQG